MPGEPSEVTLLSMPSATIRIIIAQVCQPDAHSPPTSVALAASSSTCRG
jgi:hypothetical protein